MTRMVEPQANIERMSEEEGTTDRHDMREMERGAKTKKAHWRIPPATRVRVRQRTEDGTDIYIILTFSHMLNVGY